MYDIVPASVERIADYSSLIARSKSVWQWPSGYLEEALPLLKITREYIARSSSCEILCEGKLIGFYSVVDGGDCLVLDHLWIEPDHIGRGAGRFAIGRLAATSKAKGVSAIDVWPDPPAEEFYIRLGFAAMGDSTPSRVPGGPAFQRLRLSLAQHPAFGH